MVLDAKQQVDLLVALEEQRALCSVVQYLLDQDELLNPEQGLTVTQELFLGMKIIISQVHSELAKMYTLVGTLSD